MLQELIGQMVAGTWVPSVIWESIRNNPADSAVYLSPIDTTIVPVSVGMDVESFIADLASGAFNPFAGPLVDNTGAQRNGGEDLNDEALHRMCWLVEGVVDSTAGLDQPAVVPPGCGGDY